MIQRPQKILFLTLRTFSLTGGIEKVCRGIAFTLYGLHQQKQCAFKMISLYDTSGDERYLDTSLFKAYGASPKAGAFFTMLQAFKYDTLVLSHINLAPIACLFKLLKPKCRVILWTHGIEVWRPLNWFKRRLLNVADKIIAVSAFTKSEVIKRHAVAPEKIKVLANALDPYFTIPEITAQHHPSIRHTHQIPDEAPLFFALTRLKHSEQQKNYDLVIQAIAALKSEGLIAYYIIGGKYDDAEYQRIQSLAISLNIPEQIILTGFIADAAIANYYQAADAFVLPSEKEGFGLVFIEAQACGLRVLAGNQDGSIDAVQNPNAGILVHPRDVKAIQEALKSLSQHKLSIPEQKALQKACLDKFGYERFAREVEGLVG